tara:strand:+ start:1216 stop:1437 length:222 start_codon:yes stop_codon:yes gene_type:complete
MDWSTSSPNPSYGSLPANIHLVFDGHSVFSKRVKNAIHRVEWAVTFTDMFRTERAKTSGMLTGLFLLERAIYL